MAALQTAMFPILVICLPKREVKGEEKAETGRHLKRKARIRACSMKGTKRRAHRKGEKGKEKVRLARNFPCDFPRRLLPPPGPTNIFFLAVAAAAAVPSSTSASPLHPAYSPVAKPFISVADSEAVRRNKSRLLYKCCQRE